MSGYSAQEHCQQNGMQMVTLKTSSELAVMAEEVKNLGFCNKSNTGVISNWNFSPSISVDTYFSMAAHDIGRTAGQFHWSDGTPVDSGLWFPGQPNDFVNGKQTCAWLQPESGKLHDFDCYRIYYYALCEVSAALSSCLQWDPRQSKRTRKISNNCSSK